MIQIHIRFFAGHRDIVGQAATTLLVAPDTTVGQVWDRLVEQYPPLKAYSGHLLYAVNQEFSDLATVLQDGDELAFIPPVSGGSDSRQPAPEPGNEQAFAPFAISSAPLDPAPLVAYVQTAADGAVVTFAGVVRNNFEGRRTAHLFYESYTEVALSALRQLAGEARQRWAIGRVAVHHRVGRLEIGETAVLVVVAAPHRQAAFDAAAYIMDRIKQIVPIWKREYWADGESAWHGT